MLREFVARTLPPGDTNQVQYFTAALEDAGARYDRYRANIDEWWSYAARKSRLAKIAELTGDLACNLTELDILSRDELARRSDSKEIEKLVGSLNFLGKQISELVKNVQSNGAPRDLAEEQWIGEVADIYENAFRQSASANRGSFCRLLELTRPLSFPRYGKLDRRQIKRTLQRRRKPSRAACER
jgi:hypothetical protein